VAPKSTIYHFSVDLSDMDRGVYQTFKLPVALHPSESLEYMVMRVLAFALEFNEGIQFSAGLGATDDPPLAVTALDGGYRAWIEIGAPNPERVHRAAKVAQRVAIYCHRSANIAYQQLSQESIYRAAEIPFYSFEESFISELTPLLGRRNELVLSRSEETVYVQLNGHDSVSALTERRLG
jgi:uncharacterized protein YaeQ